MKIPQQLFQKSILLIILFFSALSSNAQKIETKILLTNKKWVTGKFLGVEEERVILLGKNEKYLHDEYLSEPFNIPFSRINVVEQKHFKSKGVIVVLGAILGGIAGREIGRSLEVPMSLLDFEQRINGFVGGLLGALTGSLIGVMIPNYKTNKIFDSKIHKKEEQLKRLQLLER